MGTYNAIGWQDADCDIQQGKAASGTIATKMDVISDENGDTLAQSLIHFPVWFPPTVHGIHVESAEFRFCATFDQFGLVTQISHCPVPWAAHC